MTSDKHSDNSIKLLDGVTVVIAWVNSADLLRPGLVALIDSQTKPPVEILVATRHRDEVVETLEAEFPSVTFVRASPSTSIPKLRAKAINLAMGRFVAVTEDHCTPQNDWIERIEQQLRSQGGIVGGCIENGYTKRFRDWAAFLTEYAGAIGPAERGPTSGLPGNNVAYTRDVCRELVSVLEADRWESFCHNDVVGRGVTLFLDPDMIVSHARPFDFFYFLGQRFHFCRSYAVMRWSAPRPAQRIVYGLGCAVLPPLLWYRNLRHLISKRRNVGMYLFCTPLIFTYMIAGAIGEAVGYLVGGGHSLERVE